MCEVDPNEAPEGYVAELATNWGCDACANYNPHGDGYPAELCKDTWKMNGVPCLSNGRRDGCSVIFKKKTPPTIQRGIVNPNEAPEGYVAVKTESVTVSCDKCAFNEQLSGVLDCLNYAAMLQDPTKQLPRCGAANRKDGCEVYFVKKECPVQPECAAFPKPEETIRERSRADIMAALNMAHEERRLAEAYIAEHVAIAFKSFHEKTGLRIKGLSIETTEHRGIDGMSPYRLTSNTLVTGVRMEVWFL